MSDAYAYVKRIRIENASAKLVLNALSEYMDEEGYACPSSKRLQADTFRSARTVSSSLEALEAAGVIKRVRVYDDRGKRAPDRILVVGFKEWRDSLKTLNPRDFALSATANPSADKPQVLQQQKLHVQKLHVVEVPPTRAQDVVSRSSKTTTALSAKSAPDRIFEAAAAKKERSPTPPKEKTTPLDIFGSDEPKTSPPSFPAKSESSDPKLKRAKRPKPDYGPEFEAFWALWPAAIRGNGDKKTGRIRWAKAREQWDADTLMRAARNYLRNTKMDDSLPGPWMPRPCQPQVFLNGKLEAAVEAVSGDGKEASGRRWNAELQQWV